MAKITKSATDLAARGVAWVLATHGMTADIAAVPLPSY